MHNPSIEEMSNEEEADEIIRRLKGAYRLISPGVTVREVDISYYIGIDAEKELEEILSKDIK